MQPPWGGANQIIQVHKEFRGKGQALPNMATGDDEMVREFVRERSKVHEAFIREEAKTKRLGLILAVIMVIVASAILSFFPKENQPTAIWISAALFVFLAGAAGYKRVWGKSKTISFGANSEDSSKGQNCLMTISKDED